MRDHQHRLALDELRQGPLDLELVLRVGEGRRLVQHQDGRVLQDGPGDADALLLPAGQVDATRADGGAVPVGEALDELVALGSTRRGDHLVVRRVRPPDPDVVHHGVEEQEVVLEHERHRVHQSLVRDVPDVHAPDEDLPLPLPHVPEARDQAGDGGFTPTRGAHEGGYPPLLRMKGDGGEGTGARGEGVGVFRSLRVVGEGHVPELNVEPLRRPGVPGLGDGLSVHHGLDALYALVDLPSLHGQHRQAHHGGRRAGRHHHEEQERQRKGLARRIVPKDQEPDGQQEGEEGVGDHAKQDVAVLKGVGELDAQLPVVLKVGVEAPEGLHGAAEHLDDLHPADVLHRRGVDPLQRVVVRLQVVPALLPEPEGPLKGQGCDERPDAGQRQGHAEEEQSPDQDEHRGHGIDHLRDLMGDEELDVLDVLLHRLLDRADGGAREEPQRQPADVAGEPHADAVQDSERGHVRGHQGRVPNDEPQHHGPEGDSPLTDEETGVLRRHPML